MKYPVFICDDDQMQVNDIVKMIGKAEEILSDEHAIEFDVAFTTTFADAKKFLKDNIYTGSGLSTKGILRYTGFIPLLTEARQHILLTMSR